MNEPEWNQLISGLLDGSLTAAEQELLHTFLRDHPEKETELVHALVAERLLPVATSSDAGERTAEEVLYRIHPEITTFPVPRKPRLLPRIILPTAAAAVLCIAAWFAFENTRPVGWISRAESIVWTDNVPDGENLTRGTKLSATSGLAEIQLRNGARLLLEAPFSLELTGYKSATLRSGRLAAHCPPTAHGFTVATPQGKVIDLGTEFGVHVEDDGSVETHVLTGSVEIDRPRSQRKISLFNGEALRIDSGSSQRVAADPSAFVTRMPFSESAPDGFVHWTMDENQGFTASNTGHGLATGTDGNLTFGADMLEDPAAAPPQWINGVRGSGLSFDGVGSFAESTYRGIEGSLPRTVALWIRVPDPDPHAGTGILSWGSVLEDSAWQISINWSPKDGPVGRLRLGTFAGKIVGTTDLQDGRWHHVAVVMHPQPDPGAPVNVLLYIDGRLEPISHRSNFRVNTDIRRAAHGVTLGRHVSPINDEKKFFHGEMDDVFIFGRPLLQKQILLLMEGKADQIE